MMVARQSFMDPVADPVRSLLDLLEGAVRRALVDAKASAPSPYPIAVSRGEAARLMSVSVATVDQWIRDERVHVVETHNRRAVIATWSLFHLAGVTHMNHDLFVLDDPPLPETVEQEEEPPAA